MSNKLTKRKISTSPNFTKSKFNQIKMLLKITVICVATLQMVPFAHTKAHEIVNNSPQLAEKRKDLPKQFFK